MTTVENQQDRSTVVHDTAVAEPVAESVTGPVAAVPADVRERFGGSKVGMGEMRVAVMLSPVRPA